jgi:hypothetical protein
MTVALKYQDPEFEEATYFEVDQIHLQEGRPVDASSCALALAFSEQVISNVSPSANTKSCSTTNRMMSERIWLDSLTSMTTP